MLAMILHGNGLNGLFGPQIAVPGAFIAAGPVKRIVTDQGSCVP